METINDTTSIIVIFNQKTKAFVGFSTSPQIKSSPNILWKEVELMRGTNLAQWHWVGDYDNGELVMKAEKEYEVTDAFLMDKMQQKFFRKYPVDTCVMFMLTQFHIMNKQGKLTDFNMHPDFKKMLDFLEKLLHRYVEEVKHFQESPLHKFKTQEDLDREMEERFKV